MTNKEKADRAFEAYWEATHMALDFNQSAESRREWEKKKDEAWAEYWACKNLPGD